MRLKGWKVLLSNDGHLHASEQIGLLLHFLFMMAASEGFFSDIYLILVK